MGNRSELPGIGCESAPAAGAEWSGFLELDLAGTVHSVIECRENGPLIAAVGVLWIKPSDLVMDVTYGQGNFWTVLRPERFIAHDLAVDGVDFRQLPEADGSVDVIVFDPPYIPQGGRETSTTPDFLNRYGLVTVPKTTEELEELIAAGMKECARVLAPKGRLLVKCMDYINGARYRQGRHHAVQTAHELGLRQVDEFVHYSGTGPQPERESQYHSRRTHTFLCVFQAPARKRPNLSSVPVPDFDE